ncbi:hypothetical protein LOTGIDRAFT_136322 [Lottia gigantea]|uniref:WAP domain-containing protein n=1 Tax=Lottia gigantea TaxID=225164 RepID=V4B2S9_LOTGI|nr:hypothetical protein LOTGIDRAFT_136322 [Lottia gigantea]ESP04368.1 hypothetical protein LOTGIDRAFT_136322 [Lottia gigantea]
MLKHFVLFFFSGNIQKPGSCPWHTRFSRRTCNRECFSDLDCDGLDKCCETGCGSACTEPCFYWLRTFPTSTTAWKLPQRCSRKLYF